MFSAVNVSSSSSKSHLLLSYLIIVAASSTKLHMLALCRSNIRSSFLLPSATAFISPCRARTFTSPSTRHHSSATKVYQNKMGFANKVNRQPFPPMCPPPFSLLLRTISTYSCLGIPN
mmetsp:Transcript_13000/g.30889  ORF Transcript_13000/g.30889 Transcript_13000/m.30889 type:complete len:118 (+) Transcript_13000:151-504(+)